MRRHVSAEILARYQEGDLGSRRAASVGAHLAACEQCTRTGSDLGAVSSLLAGLEQPAMPAALAERLSLVIASESAARAAGAAAGAVPTGGVAAGDAHPADDPAAGVPPAGSPADHIPGRPDLPERSRQHRSARLRLRWPGLSSPVLLRGTAAVAVVIVLASTGFLLARGQAGPASTGSGGSSSGGAGAPAASGPGEHRAASQRERAGLTGYSRLHYRLNGRIVTATALASHTNFTRSGLAGQVHKAVASHVTFGTLNVSPGTTPGPANGKRSGSSLLGGVKVGTLNGCLNRVSAGRRVVLAEIARYLGARATIIVLKSLTANILDVAVVGLACSASAPDYIVRTTVPAR
ncbi:MAG: hypothetical protein ACR2FU_14530 [Streptosporangiaceae bacterium]